MNEKGKLILGVGLALLVAIPFAMASLERVVPGVPATVVDNNQTFSVLIIAQDLNHTSMCVDLDQGFNPLVKSDMNAVYSDRNNMLINYTDHCDGNTLIEFACGGQISLNGQTIPVNSYGFAFNCADLNKVCVAGACV